MNKFSFKTRIIISTAKKIMYLLCLYNILLLHACGCDNPSQGNNPYKNKIDNFSNNIDTSAVKPNEVIVFLGNPGVGKTTLFNSIFQKAVFNSGVSLGTGMTTCKQEKVHENKLYIDTPGLEDVERSKQAAEEIEKALKHNNNYKIVFVATFESGRIRPADLVTINTICDAIQTNFEYGLIFNKVTKGIIEEMNQQGKNEELLLHGAYLNMLHKKPSLVMILTKNDEMEDRKNRYFQSSDENRGKFLNFLNNLNASRILDNEVKKIDVRDFKKQVEKMEQEYKKIA